MSLGKNAGMKVCASGAGVAVLLSMMLPCALVLAVEEPLTSLHHNPFKRPALEGIAGKKNAPGEMDKPTGKELDLRAVVADGSASLVSVNGQFVKIGEQVEGYQLVSVQEGHAVFMRDGHQVKVQVWREEVGSEANTAPQY